MKLSKRRLVFFLISTIILLDTFAVFGQSLNLLLALSIGNDLNLESSHNPIVTFYDNYTYQNDAAIDISRDTNTTLYSDLSFIETSADSPIRSDFIGIKVLGPNGILSEDGLSFEVISDKFAINSIYKLIMQFISDMVTQLRSYSFSKTPFIHFRNPGEAIQSESLHFLF